MDEYHASDTLNIISGTVILVWLNRSLVNWFSNTQTSVESSRFGSKFMAMNKNFEYPRGLRYKLRMMIIPCDGQAYIEGDNKSTLSKKLSLIIP